MSWQQITRGKRDHLHSLIPPEWKLSAEMLPSRMARPNVTDIVPSLVTLSEREITELPVERLLREIHTGGLAAREVLDAFCHRAALAHQLTRCLSEINFEEAIRTAGKLDAYWREHQKPIGPLHGLPVSLMDRFHVAGLDSTCGFASWIGQSKSAQDEGVLVQQLRRLGAIIFCKTNVPMSVMMGETVNNITGATLNPRNRMLSAGGACGGEGALIALKGSPLGFGTDLAGSSRIPAAFNGLYALKVTEGRLSRSGLATVLRGLPIAAGSLGILSHSIDGLAISFKAILESKPWLYDPEVVEIPWRQDKFDSIISRTCSRGQQNGRLTFGILSSDDFVEPHPTIGQAIAIVKKALQQCGYEVVDWKPPKQNTAVDNLFRIFGADSGKCIREAIDASGEPPVAQLKDWYSQGNVDSLPTAEFWELCHALREYRRQYAEYWRHMGGLTRSGRQIDGVIQPIAPSTAVRDGEFHYYGYSAITNVLDYPAAAFPVGLESDLPQDIKGQSLSATDELVRSCYRAKDAQGMPVGLQIICHRNQEEKLLGLLQAVSGSLEMSKQGR
ncbi:hypothetical protein M433DRAFT_75476 [Acidomyces richmondensis BFW]|nr:hypothetical protein M433DRAFT_75476 [Acidomyces richmondensis BFW]